MSDELELPERVYVLRRADGLWLRGKNWPVHGVIYATKWASAEDALPMQAAAKRLGTSTKVVKIELAGGVEMSDEEVEAEISASYAGTEIAGEFESYRPTSAAHAWPLANDVPWMIFSHAHVALRSGAYEKGAPFYRYRLARSKRKKKFRLRSNPTRNKEFEAFAADVVDRGKDPRPFADWLKEVWSEIA